MNTDIHRLLDEAFDGIDMTPDARDLKEEMRANLMARTAELEAAGSSPSDAAHTAIAELGPVEDLLGGPSVPTASATTASATASATTASAAELHALNKVRPKPGFVVRTTLLSVGAAAAATLAVLAAFDVIGGGADAVAGLGVAAAVALGWVTGDSLRQETTTNFAMPTARAAGYGLATFAALAAAALFAAFAMDTSAVALAIIGGVVLLASLGLFSWLGATQTNRHKAWVRASGYTSHQGHGNRFETDPDAAARYGIYQGIVWIIGIGAAIWLSIAFAWWWSLVVLGACVVASMLMLATMLFGARKEPWD